MNEEEDAAVDAIIAEMAAERDITFAQMEYLLQQEAHAWVKANFTLRQRMWSRIREAIGDRNE